MSRKDHLLEAPLTGKVLDRRTLLKGGTAATAGLLLSSALPIGSARAEPKRGGHLRLGLRGGSTTDTFDPSFYPDVFMGTLAYSIGNALVEIKPDNTIGPELAESWEARPGAAEWVFRLRKDVTFHNGKPFEAEDVIANIAHHRKEGTKSGMKTPLKPIKTVTAEDKHTLVFTLEAGNADFPYIFTDYRLIMFPSKEGEIVWQAGAGTGGYRVLEFEPGVRARVERNPDYWRGDTHAHFDSAELITMTDAAARQNALMTGAIDTMDSVDLKTVGFFSKQEGVNVVSTKGALHYTFAMDSLSKEFSNNDLRLAMKYAIDREDFVRRILKGYGAVGNDHPIAPTMQFFAPDLEQRVYDPDRAKHHLKKAGMEGFEISLSTAESLYNGAVDAAVLYKESAAPAGIDITVVREPSDGYWSNVWKKRTMFAGYWGARPTADLILSTAYVGGAPWNETSLSSERLDQLVAAARAELDKDKRAEMYRDIQILLRDEGSTIIPAYASNVFAISDKVAHADSMSANWELDGRRAVERWWFA